MFRDFEKYTPPHEEPGIIKVNYTDDGNTAVLQIVQPSGFSAVFTVPTTPLVKREQQPLDADASQNND